jgi:hypothetical protein
MSDKEEEQEQEQDNNKPSGFQLTKQRSQSTEEQQQQVITNASVDVNARTSNLTGEDPSIYFSSPNIADGFKPSQKLVNSDGEEI